MISPPINNNNNNSDNYKNSDHDNDTISDLEETEMVTSSSSMKIITVTTTTSPTIVEKSLPSSSTIRNIALWTLAVQNVTSILLLHYVESRRTRHQQQQYYPSPHHQLEENILYKNSTINSAATTAANYHFSTPMANVCTEMVKLLISVLGLMYFWNNDDDDYNSDDDEGFKAENVVHHDDDEEDRTRRIENNSSNKHISPFITSCCSRCCGISINNFVSNNNYPRLSRVLRALFARDAYKMIFIAAIYAVENNLYYIALRNLQATVFQVVYQMKLIVTAVMMWLILNRKLSYARWAMVVTVFVGIVITEKSASSSSSKKSSSSSSSSSTTSSSHQNITLGLLSVLGCAICSSFANVYFESVIKAVTSSTSTDLKNSTTTKFGTSLFVRNAQLASFSVISNFLIYIASIYFQKEPGNAMNNNRRSNNQNTTTTSSSSPTFLTRLFTQNPLAGFDDLVWLVVVLQALGGLLVSVILKYGDAIVKALATAVAIVLNGVISMMLFHFSPNLMYLVGASIVIFGVLGYAKFN